MARVKRRKKVSFWATKKVPKKVKVTFYAKPKKFKKKSLKRLFG